MLRTICFARVRFASPCRRCLKASTKPRLAKRSRVGVRQRARVVLHAAASASIWLSSSALNGLACNRVQWIAWTRPMAPITVPCCVPSAVSSLRPAEAISTSCGSRPWPTLRRRAFPRRISGVTRGGEIERLIQEMAHLSGQELLDQVYRRLVAHLCGRCYRQWIEDPIK